MTGDRDTPNSAVDRALRELARQVAEPTPDDVARVLADADGRHQKRRFAASHARRLVLACLVTICGLIIAFPPARASAHRVFRSITSFFEGGDPPGDPLPVSPGAHPNLLDGALSGSPRVLASHGEYRLVAYRQDTGNICFSLADLVAECRPPQEWRTLRFAGRPLTLLVVTETARPNRRLLWGLAASPDVTGVRVDYRRRPSIHAPVKDFGFIVPVPTGPTPSRVVALTDHGTVVGSTPTHDPSLQWRPTPFVRSGP